jgi:hypothetical protein
MRSLFLTFIRKGCLNSKFEARNPKLETNTNSQSAADPGEKVLNFENWKFGFVSDFDIGISKLGSRFSNITG